MVSTLYNGELRRTTSRGEFQWSYCEEKFFVMFYVKYFN